jgi:hypothetical protein
MHWHTSFLASSAISFSFTIFFIIAIPANLLASNFLSSSSFLLWISLLILMPSWTLTSSAICLWSSLNYLTQINKTLVFKSHFMDSPSSWWWPMMINDPSLGEFNQCIAKLNTDNMCWLLSAWNIIVHKLKIVWFSIRTMNTIYVIEYSSIWFNMLMIIHKDGVDFIYI